MALSGPDTKSNGRLKSIRTRVAYSENTGRPSSGTATYEPSTVVSPTPKSTDGERGGRGDLLAKARGYQMAHNGTMPIALNQLTLFAEGFHASPTPWLVNAADLPTSAISGRTSPDSFASLDPDGSWRKTCQGYSQVTLDGSLERFSETWPRAGMTRNGIAYRLPPSAPLTGETASGLWPTPEASNATTGQIWGKDDRLYWTGEKPRRVVRSGVHASLGLARLVQVQMWPTPCTTDANNVPYQKGKGGQRYPMLLGAVRPRRCGRRRRVGIIARLAHRNG